MNKFVDMTNYNDLIACDSKDVVRRTRCVYDKQDDQYRIHIWDMDYIVDLKTCSISAVDPSAFDYVGLMDLFILYVLMGAKRIPPTGEWISEKDIPGGAAFFRGPHTIPTHLLVNRFGDDLTSFEDICVRLGGREINLADSAYAFSITPDIPVALLYWQGDEDFPSEAKMLFDKNIHSHLPLDIIFCLAEEVCHRLAKQPSPGA